MNYIKISFKTDRALIKYKDADKNIEINYKDYDNSKNILDSFVNKIKKQNDDLEGVVIETTTDSIFTYKGTPINIQYYLQDSLNLPVLVNPKITSEQNLNEEFKKQKDYYEWNLTYSGYEGGKSEKSKESLLTIGNGFMGIRGALVETKSSENNYPGTYVAGLYNKLTTNISGRDVVNEDFVNIQNSQYINIKIEGSEFFDPNKDTIHELTRVLNFKTGEFTTKMVAEDRQNNIFELTTKKVSNMYNSHVYAISYSVKPLNFSKNICIVTELDGDITNEGVDRYKTLSSKHLNPVSANVKDNIATLSMKTNESNVEIVTSSKINTFEKDIKSETTQNTIKQSIEIALKENEIYTIEKIVSIHTSHETKDNLTDKSIKLLNDYNSYGQILEESTNEWDKIWNKVDVVISGDMLSQKLLRLHAYHLLVSASPNNDSLDTSVTARGLHGEAYRGHIFWDEIFVLPFYDVHFQKTARQLLMYRYNRLNAARAYAKEYGYKGAMFPWQSGADGDEQTQTLHLNPITNEWGADYSPLQRHVSFAVAYNVWFYWHITDDNEFMEKYGLEMLLEVARFWLSKSIYDEDTKRYYIDKVMGPDEFHEKYIDSKDGGFKNNAYTNMMFIWLLETLPTILEKITEKSKNEIFKKINFTSDEFTLANKIKHNLELDIREDGIIGQFSGYFDLKELDFDEYRKKYGNIYRMDRILKAEGKTADEYKVAKQPDTLMTFYNLDKDNIDQILKDLGYDLPNDYVLKNLHYYLDRTSHGSTLSRVVHADLAQIIDEVDLSWELFEGALGSDYTDVQGGTTAEGIHTGLMAATLIVTLSTYAGVNLKKDLLQVNPKLPKKWNEIKFNLTFKGVNYNFRITKSEINITSDKDSKILVKNKYVSLISNKEEKITY